MRRHASRLTLLAMTIALAATAGVAWAGGWAVATLHPVKTAPVAGEPTTIAYSLRQHGITPRLIGDTRMEIVAADGTVMTFAGKPLARTGRYSATVTFPSAGTWRWRVIKGPFGTQELGTVTVAAAGAPAAGPALDGRALFLAKGCGVCHFGPDSKATVGVGPSLRGLADRFPRKAGLDYIRQSIRNPNAVTSGGGGTFSRMPLLEVTMGEAEAIARYLLAR